VRSAVVNKTLINLNVPHLPWSGKVVLREVQRHSWKEELHHLSFFFPGEDFIATSTAETPVEVIAAAEA
jgi:large subunit ribosomal protein L25